MNTIIITGRLAKDPEIRETAKGTTVANFAVAVSKGLGAEERRAYEMQGKRTADFFEAVCFGRLAEIVQSYCHKGDMVGVTGRMEQETWQDREGKTRTTYRIIANTVDFLQTRHAGEEEPKRRTPKSGGWESVDVPEEDIPF